MLNLILITLEVVIIMLGVGILLSSKEKVIIYIITFFLIDVSINLYILVSEVNEATINLVMNLQAVIEFIIWISILIILDKRYARVYLTFSFLFAVQLFIHFIINPITELSSKIILIEKLILIASFFRLIVINENIDFKQFKYLVSISIVLMLFINGIQVLFMNTNTEIIYSELYYSAYIISLSLMLLAFYFEQKRIVLNKKNRN